MKLTIVLLSAVVAVSAAQPHRHGHQHAHVEARQVPTWSEDVVVVPGPTEVAYVLNGHLISEAEVEEGLRNGTLMYAPGGGVVVESSVSHAATATKPPSHMASPPSSSPSVYAPATTSSTSTSAPAPTSSSAWTSSSYVAPPSSSAATAASSAPSSPSSSPSAAAGSSSASSNGAGYNSNTAPGLNTPFPDGQLDCGTFPSEYGAVPIDWFGLGGWTGIQSPGSNNGGFSDIETIDSNICSSGQNCCSEGMFCSYACPAGYLKSQWPSTQGATGQSVGGLQCSGGKLHLTNPGLSSNLCIPGTDQVTVKVQNNLSGNVAVCRTDYPGTESETLPLDVAGGTTNTLACPDEASYYKHEGSYTSAQYYVNPEGVAVSDACNWGSPGNPWGNFAPLNLGVGYSNGAAYLSIFQNLPTTSAKLQYSVELVAADGGNMVGQCKYFGNTGQYCNGPDYSICSSTTGCTVSISSGTAVFVFSDS